MVLMEVGVLGLKGTERAESEKDRLLLKKTTLKLVLQQCQRSLELLNNAGCVDDDDDSGRDDAAVDNGEQLSEASLAQCCDEETDELYDLLKSRVECPDFLEKLENAQASIHQNMAESMCMMIEDGNSWDVVNENDLWEGGSTKLDQEDYVLVSQEDIVEGIACFMAAYLLSLKQTKDLTPNQLQEALGKTFSVKRKKGKLRKAWEGSQVIYNVASWSATAIGIYQNPALLKAASSAFWTSCQAISKLF